MKANPLILKCYRKYIYPIIAAYIRKKEAKMSDLDYFIYRHKRHFGYKADFANPRTFNERIIHRILFDRNPIYTHLSDKLKARIYIAKLLDSMTCADSTNIKNIESAHTSSHINLACLRGGVVR